MPSSKLEAAVERLRSEYRHSAIPWFVGFSGGKDSSAVLRILYTALSRERVHRQRITVVYCDTGVEIPHVCRRVHRTLKLAAKEARSLGLPITVRVARPRASDTYFVRVIGRGYPPPTNKFRWCTDRLRIGPVRRVLEAQSAEEALVVLGTRFAESKERDRALSRHGSGETYHYRQKGNGRAMIYAPIVDFSVEEVWSALFGLKLPTAIDAVALAQEYREAGAECPMVRETHGPPCGSGRFGCWTCTVVRRDKAVTSLVAEGHSELEPLLAFRNWLQQMRDEPKYRCRVRRNGAKGPGPLTLMARREALRRLRLAQSRVPWRLITDEEITEIHRLWRADRESETYRE